jgi:hypothetical protein
MLAYSPLPSDISPACKKPTAHYPPNSEAALERGRSSTPPALFPRDLEDGGEDIKTPGRKRLGAGFILKDE